MTTDSRKPTLIYETVLEHIKYLLLEGELRAGDRLPTVNAMAEELGVGPASVREAYRVLETMGILEVRQGRGTTVARSFIEPTGRIEDFKLAQQQSVSTVMETRRLIEPAVAALAAERATASEREAILKSAREMDRIVKEGNDFGEPDLNFHDLIFAAAHNPTLARTLSGLRELMIDLRRLVTRDPIAVEKAVHYHQLIALAIYEDNADAAEALMKQHLEEAERELQKNLERVTQ